MITKSGNGSEELFGRVAAILDQARGNAVRSINHNMVVAYWLIGREIVMEMQASRQRAEYGDALLRGLAEKLTESHGAGYSVTTLKYFRSLYLTYSSEACEKGRTLCDLSVGSVGSDSNSSEITKSGAVASPPEPRIPDFHCFPSWRAGRLRRRCPGWSRPRDLSARWSRRCLGNWPGMSRVRYTVFVRTWSTR